MDIRIGGLTDGKTDDILRAKKGTEGHQIRSTGRRTDKHVDEKIDGWAHGQEDGQTGGKREGQVDEWVLSHS